MNFDLPQQGIGKYTASHLRNESNLKKWMDRLLDQDETFLDLTRDGGHYFSSGRRVITEYPVYYVYPGEPPQFRAIKALRKHKTRVSLLQSSYFDKSPAPLRTHYLYRYALLNGLALKISPQDTLLVPPEYFSPSAGLDSHSDGAHQAPG